jgi:hypothetical protein
MTVLAMLAAAGVWFSGEAARGWDAAGHRAITWLALDGLSPDAPAFLREAAVRHMVGWQAAEPDRWRGTKSNVLAHENNPDHYMDIEDLSHYGLTLETVSPLRYRFIADMAVARHVHPEAMGKPYNPKLDPSGQQEWPGFVLHAVLEHQAKLSAMFKTYRALEKLNDPARAPQMEMTKANIMAEMGILAHFAGDLAQPLHTTKHHHGWVGENPQGYTTDGKIHAYIDGGVIALHKLNYAALKPTQKYETKVQGLDAWAELVAYAQRSHDQVETVYSMKKSGALERDEGKAFITERLNDAGAMLAALYNAAWKASEIDQKYVDDFLKYDGFDPNDLPADARTTPAAR